MTKEKLKRYNEIENEINEINSVLRDVKKDNRYVFKGSKAIPRFLDNKMVVMRLTNVLKECKDDLKEELEELKQ